MSSQRPSAQMLSHGGSVSTSEFWGDTDMRFMAVLCLVLCLLSHPTPQDPREAEIVSDDNRS